MNTAINGYLDEIHDRYKDSSSVRISYDKASKSIGRRKSSTTLSIFRKATDWKRLKNRKLRSPQDEYSVDKQMKQLKEEIKAHSIKEANDEDNVDDT